MKTPHLLRRLRCGFTLPELLVVIVVVAILVGMAIPSVFNAKQETGTTHANANAKLLNEQIARAKLDGDTDPSLSGNDEVALAKHLVEAGYIVKFK